MRTINTVMERRTSCINDSGNISWTTFNNLLESVSFDDTIDHLYEFDFKNVTEREFAYNEIYPPIIEKQRIIDPCEDLYFSCWNNLLEVKTMHQNLTDQQLRHTQIFFLKNFADVFRRFSILY